MTYPALFNGIYAISPNGYTNDELELLWLENVFEEQASELAKGQPQILFTDDHVSPGTAELLLFCFAHTSCYYN